MFGFPVSMETNCHPNQNFWQHCIVEHVFILNVCVFILCYDILTFNLSKIDFFFLNHKNKQIFIVKLKKKNDLKWTIHT